MSIYQISLKQYFLISTFTFTVIFLLSLIFPKTDITHVLIYGVATLISLTLLVLNKVNKSGLTTIILLNFLVVFLPRFSTNLMLSYSLLIVVIFNFSFLFFTNTETIETN
jgi:hypothetical protein